MRYYDKWVHAALSHLLKNVVHLPHACFFYPILTTWRYTDSRSTKMSDPSDDNCPDFTVCVLVKQAIVLEKNYKEMLLQGNEVNLRVKLWTDAIEICKMNSKSMSFMPI
jgi:hypothetical protein